MSRDSSVRADRYDTRLYTFIKGKNDYAIVYYNVFNEAIQAVVETTLLAKEGHLDASHVVCVVDKFLPIIEILIMLVILLKNIIRHRFLFSL